jgi:hypothetical protein
MRRWVAAAVGVGAWLWGCAERPIPVIPSGSEHHAPAASTGTSDAGSWTQSPGEQPSRPDAGARDAGSDAGRDAGVADAGVDAGVDAGIFDAGSGVVFPDSAGWQFYGPESGLPGTVYGVSADEGGNLWVAGGDQGLFLLVQGEAQFRRFTAAEGLTPFVDENGIRTQKVISVLGAAAGSAWVGYAGVHGGAEMSDPPHLVKSGDADHVVFNGAGLAVTHFDISTPPGADPHYPAGRDLIRDVLRIVRDPASGDVWFGGNHGIGLWQPSKGALQEHEHADINGYLGKDCTSSAPQNCRYTLMSGDYYGVGLMPNGDVVYGGGHRVARKSYGGNRQFWSPVVKLDVWPDAQPYDGYPDQRTDDFVQDLAVASDGTVWVGSIPNGLAFINPQGAVGYVTAGLIDRKVTALEVDPLDGSIWVGHIWGGVARLGGAHPGQFGAKALGLHAANASVLDIQSTIQNGTRRILVAFGSGAVGVFSGP